MTPREVLSVSRQAFERAVEEQLPQLFPLAIECLFARARTTESKSEQMAAHQARYYLQERKELLAPKILFFLRQLLDRSLETAYQHFQPRNVFQSGSQLSLVEDAQFEGALNFMNITQRLRDCGGQELNELNLRITALFGQTEIRERENPFRPYILANSISQAVDAMHFDASTSKVTKYALSEGLASKISGIYQYTNKTMQSQGVGITLNLQINKKPDLQPFRNGATSFPHSDKPDTLAKTTVVSLRTWLSQLKSSGADDAYASVDAGRLSWLADKANLGEAVRKIFGKADVKFTEGIAQPYLRHDTDGSQRELGLPARFMPYLRELQTQGVLTQPGQSGFSRSVLVKILGRLHRKNSADEAGRVRKLLEYREDLLSLCERAEQKMAIDLVIMLCEAWQQDADLPEFMRQKLNRLDFLFAQLALMDSSLFPAARHPARLLLNRMAAVMAGTRFYPAAEKYFSEESAKIFKTLAKHDCEIPGLFERIYARLNVSLEKDLRSLDKISRRSARVISEAQLRFEDSELLRMKISAALDQFPGFSQQFRSFLEQDWVRAILIASRQDAELLKAFCEFVPWIVWAIQPKTDDRQRQLSGSYFPDLMHILRQGFELLDLNSFRQNALYSWLNDIHERTGQQIAVGAKSFDECQLLFEELRGFQPRVRSETILRSQFGEIQPFIQTVADEIQLPVRYLSEDRNTSQQFTQSPFQRPKSAADADHWSERLHAGSGFELFQAGQWTRMCVIWRDNCSCAWVILGGPDYYPLIADFSFLQTSFSRGSARLIGKEDMFERAVQKMIVCADAIESH